LPGCLDAHEEFFQGRAVTPGCFVDCLTQQLSTKSLECARIFLIEAG
jgi:hypothetical protein